ncbi:hypothetical protein TWF970_005453 [Orbilia oligospora]|uniref:Steroid 5-alpha reductase C-terminal domain-containing protein n=1 Tax=Orbilia oligospora TaxID=2813651 RepID=A0A7C8RFQ9_ORBOL|nr:hypothetical protein TWF970_005453 [Orbilia oligospora]
MSTQKAPENSLSVQRGNYTSSLPGPFLFVAFRTLTVPIQYLILTRSTTLLPLKSLTLSQTLLLAMPSYIAFKHITWSLLLMRERMTLPFAFFGGISDLAFECLTSYIYTLHPINPTYSPSLLIPGTILNIIGISTELISEIQRHKFKSDPRNKGKIYTGGLWGIVRNVNYACNILFAFGYASAAGGVVYGVMYSGIYVMNFMGNAIPGIEAYMKGKYGSQWEAVEKKVKWRLCPGIY